MTPRRGIAATLGGQWAKTLVQVLGLVLLARLIDPSAFGIVTMVTSIAGLAVVLGDFGLSLAAIQARHLSDGQRTTLFWVNVGIGALTCALLQLAAPAIASVYGEPLVEPATRVAALSFLVGGFSVQFRVEATRLRLFGRLAVADVVSQTLGLAVALAMVASGQGVWALVVQPVAAAAGYLLCAVGSVRWRPGLPGRGHDVRALLSFGGTTSATQVVNYVSSNVDSVVVGRVWGPEELGVYGRVFQLFMLPLRQVAAPLTRVALPAMAAVKDSPARLWSLCERAQLLIGYPMVLGMAVLAALAEPVIRLTLGSVWASGADILRVLVVGGAFQALGYVYYWALLATARTRLMFVCETVGRLGMVALVLGAVQLGVVHVAAAYSLGLVLVWVLTTYVAVPRIGGDPARMTVATVRVLLVAIAVYAAGRAVAVPMAAGGVPDVVVIAAGAGAGAAAVALTALLPPVRRDLAVVVATARGRTPRADAAPAPVVGA